MQQFPLSASTTAARRGREGWQEPLGRYYGFAWKRRHETTAWLFIYFIYHRVGFFILFFGAAWRTRPARDDLMAVGRKKTHFSPAALLLVPLKQIKAGSADMAKIYRLRRCSRILKVFWVVVFLIILIILCGSVQRWQKIKYNKSLKKKKSTTVTKSRPKHREPAFYGLASKRLQQL